MKKLLMGWVVILVLVGCDGGSNPPMLVYDDCINSRVSCLSEDWEADPVIFVNERGNTCPFWSDGTTFYHVNYYEFVSGQIEEVHFTGWVDTCTEGTPYELGYSGGFYDIEGYLQICDDKLVLTWWYPGSTVEYTVTTQADRHDSNQSSLFLSTDPNPIGLFILINVAISSMRQRLN